MLISVNQKHVSRNPFLALYDPDEHELEEFEGIGIFVPGATIEREIDRSNMIHILAMTGLALGVSGLLGLVIAF